ncbi:hypothetical protein KP77_20880 [Jeotgalibacillus alimentarius]|uniref:RNase H type-1 domain-containing protein n=1 Tax=Jeotgalibacillus alimentarius TaxID=135826 RepID=A0A0C2VJ15_9BACL|nr:reverse transcriptase-like protein [Jeotgalibacillus alimentarius]KIL48877.1 hypothetical protein KP77_20880 [Jeotgalibacillus alimentarius]
MNIFFKATYQHPSGSYITFQSSWIDEKSAPLFIQDFEKTGRFHSITIHDDLGQEWTVKEFKKLMTKTEGEAKNIHVLFDASFDKGTRETGLGWIITYDRNGESVVEKSNRFVSGVSSNNEAEYMSLYYALEHAIRVANGHIQQITCSGDALTVINQLSGEWPSYDENLNKWADRIEKLAADKKMPLVFKHITRSNNKGAHKLADQARSNVNIKSQSRTDKDE